MYRRPNRICFSFVVLLLCAYKVGAQESAKIDEIKVDWAKVTGISKSTPRLQVVVNPQLLRGAMMHDASFTAFHYWVLTTSAMCPGCRIPGWLSLS